MNNNAPAILKTLIIYAICVPLAIWIGCLLTNPWDRKEFIIVGGLVMLLLMPILLRWHHLLLVFCWSLPMMIFFLQGQPMLGLLMIALSFGIAILQRALSQNMRFIPVPALTWPMLFLAAVVIATAKLTGGFGFRSLGNEVMGGKKYAYIFLAIMGYFALTSQRIPPRKAWLYVVLFFLPSAAGAIGDLAGVLPKSFNYLFLFFPANSFSFDSQGDLNLATRFSGITHLVGTLNYILLARYGLRGIFLSGRPWRIGVFLICMFFSLAGGFRSILFGFLLLMAILFFLEGLHRSKLMPVAILAGLLALMIAIPFADKLPFGFQRTLSLLPMINVSAEAKVDGQASTEWRMQMWKAVLPQVPGYLLLGKGYALSQSDFRDMTGHYRTIDAAAWGAAIAGDYHSGPLSVIIPFGIWGVIALLWLLIGGGRVLYNNYRYGDPALKTINTLFLAMYLASVFSFFFIFGSLSSDLIGFAGTFGLSVSLNGGMCRRPAMAPVKAPDHARIPAPDRPRLQPFYPR